MKNNTNNYMNEKNNTNTLKKNINNNFIEPLEKTFKGKTTSLKNNNKKENKNSAKNENNEKPNINNIPQIIQKVLKKYI